MSTTLDARLAALKDGDTVKVQTWTRPFEFIGIREGKAILWQPSHARDDIGFVALFSADRIIWPEPPRAKPGVVYRHKPTGMLRCGYHDGQLWNNNYAPLCEMSSDWIEVTDEQEPRR